MNQQKRRIHTTQFPQDEGFRRIFYIFDQMRLKLAWIVPCGSSVGKYTSSSNCQKKNKKLNDSPMHQVEAHSDLPSVLKHGAPRPHGDHRATCTHSRTCHVHVMTLMMWASCCKCPDVTIVGSDTLHRGPIQVDGVRWTNVLYMFGLFFTRPLGDKSKTVSA